MRLRVALPALVAVGGCVYALSCIPALVPRQLGPRCGDDIISLDAGETCDPGSTASATCSADCQIQCDGGWIYPATHKCNYLPSLKPYSTKLAFGQACGNGASPVFVGSESQLRNLFSQLATQRLGEARLLAPMQRASSGLANYIPDRPGIPGWSRQCSGCFAYAAGRPNPKLNETSDSGSCVVMSSANDGSPQIWTQAPCEPADTREQDGGRPPFDGGQLPIDGGRPQDSESWSFHVVCEQSPQGSRLWSCDGGFCFDVPAAFPYKTYLYAESAVSFDVARSTCAARGGQLVVFNSVEERLTINDAIAARNGATAYRYWIGLSMLGDGGSAWIDGVEGDRPDARAVHWGTPPAVENSAQGAGAFIYFVPNQKLEDNGLAQVEPPLDAGPDAERPNGYVCEFGKMPGK